MPSFSARLLEHVLDLGWSLWTEAGVAGWTRRHATWAIDPEPLILFTAALGDADPRLRDESTDWCIRYGRYLSAARLRNLLRRERPEVRTAFGRYAATVNAHAAVSWPGATEPREYRPTGRSALAGLGPPALISLRLRALFGVGARAEILRGFVAHPDGPYTAADLASDAGYTKRNVEKELESLRLAGLTGSVRVRGQVRHRLARPQELLAFVGARPVVYARWSAIFHVLYDMLEVAGRVEDLEPPVRAVEARRTIRALEVELERADLAGPDASLTGEAFWATFEQWALLVASKLAAGDRDAFRAA